LVNKCTVTELREVGPGQRERWPFEEAIEALDKKMRDLGLGDGGRRRKGRGEGTGRRDGAASNPA
jgi:hypothetical protein